MDSSKKDFYEKYDYNERTPHFVKPEELTKQQYDRLVKEDNFCMMPWVHMHAFPDGRVYPCCLNLVKNVLSATSKSKMASFQCVMMPIVTTGI